MIVEEGEEGAKRTLKVLKGILEGVWLLKVDWCRDSVTRGQLADEKEWEVAKVHSILDKSIR